MQRSPRHQPHVGGVGQTFRNAYANGRTLSGFKVSPIRFKTLLASLSTCAA